MICTAIEEGQKRRHESCMHPASSSQRNWEFESALLSIRRVHSLNASATLHLPTSGLLVSLLSQTLLHHAHFATAALRTCVRKNPPFVRSMTCW